MGETHASHPGLSGYFDDEGNYYAEDGQVYPRGYFEDVSEERPVDDHEPQLVARAVSRSSADRGAAR
jgi:hypothetical protein